MLGLLFRLLPFWVREPLFIVVGSVFGVRIMYLALHDHAWPAVGIGVAFLVFTAVRVHTVIRALRARRDMRPTASADSTAPDAAVRPQPQPPAGRRPASAAPGKEPNAWGQAVAAVALFAVLGAALWLGPRVLPSEDDSTPRAASCPRGEGEALPGAYEKTPRAVTGDELCEALNTPDLARLLGTPAETATVASGTSGTAPLTDGKVAQPKAEVQFDTYTVNVSVAYNELSIAQYVNLMELGKEPEASKVSVLDRPAVLSSGHTMAIEIDLGSGGSGGPVEQGPPSRTLSVALDRKDRGGYCDITVWSRSGALPDDSALLAIAETVLPAISERTT
ncbi:DUF6215 domain-containing protein [Streptomyces sp. NRRL_ISP-5395]|uniref:DUF6215 domain-containing protein n=1 Tax=Streptomyces TaxID=1883 RepID=UPI001875213D|nr:MULTISPECIES: DUF6215 domain-containing protein [Streptomyces]MDX2668385.1 DUF6215 domain-containing protein [Streptomyces sp. NRRL_ISP-5395]GHF50226.1 hypothetical protein GCM10010504_17920 [Streptomyces griseus]